MCISLILFLLVGVVFLYLVSLLVVRTAADKIVDGIDELEQAQAVLVLGASVYSSGRLSPVLQDRADMAIAIYRAGIVPKVLVSGDNSTLSYNEVIPVHTYLIAQGIPARDIFLDYAGFDTFNSMYRARSVFEVRTAIIPTQSFHLARAVYLADALGIEVQGIVTEPDRGTPKNHIREFPANLKAMAHVVFRSKPRYLGERFPITGDGRVTLVE